MSSSILLSILCLQTAAPVASEPFALPARFQSVPGLPALPSGWTLTNRAHPETSGFHSSPVYLNEEAQLGLFEGKQKPASLSLRPETGVVRALVSGAAGGAEIFFSVQAIPDCDGDRRDDALWHMYTAKPERYGLRVVSSATGRKLAERWAAAGAYLYSHGAAVDAKGRVELAMSYWWPIDSQLTVGGPPRDACLEVWTLPDLEPRLSVRETATGSYFGKRVRWAGDWDGDGSRDLLVSSPERVRESGAQGCLELFSGSDGHLIRSWNVADFGLKLPLSRTYALGLDMVLVGNRFDVAVSFEASASRNGSMPEGYLPLVYVLDLRDSKVISKCDFDVGTDYAFGVQPALEPVPDCDGDGFDDVLVFCEGFALVLPNGSGSQVGSASFVSSRTGKLVARFRGTDEENGHVGWSTESTQRGRRRAITFQTHSDTWVLERK